MVSSPQSWQPNDQTATVAKAAKPRHRHRANRAPASQHCHYTIHQGALESAYEFGHRGKNVRLTYLLLFVLLLLQATPTKGLLSCAAPSCNNSVLSACGASATASAFTAVLPALRTPSVEAAPAFKTARSIQTSAPSGGCCGGNTACDTAPEAPEDRPWDGSLGGCTHCTCTAEEPPPYTLEFPATPAASSKSLAPEITWVLAGLETFVRDLPSLGDASASFLRSLCFPPVQRVERNVFHCIFQT